MRKWRVGQMITGLEVRDAHVLAVPEAEPRAGVVGRPSPALAGWAKTALWSWIAASYWYCVSGMTGDIGAYRDAPDAPRFTRVAWQLADSGLSLAFIDPRKFGRIRLADSVEAYQKAKKLGPDALQITAAELHQNSAAAGCS
ncbi:MAG: DNA-formamidopyrimidine glycosylase family protein [Hymenobacter sp.]